MTLLTFRLMLPPYYVAIFRCFFGLAIAAFAGLRHADATRSIFSPVSYARHSPSFATNVEAAAIHFRHDVSRCACRFMLKLRP